MEENSKRSENRSKIRRLLRGFKKHSEEKCHNEALSKLIPAAGSSIVDQRPNAIAPSASIESAHSIIEKPRSTISEPSTRAEHAAPAVANIDSPKTNAEENLPASIALANERLKKTEERLKKKLSEDIMISAKFEIKTSIDINSLVDSIEATLATMME